MASNFKRLRPMPMKRDGDRKARGRYYWLAKSPDARVIRLSSYLRGDWGKVNKAVIDQRLGVTLIDKDNLTELGTVLPPDLLYVFHMKVTDERQFFPVYHVDINDFRQLNPVHILRVEDRFAHLILLEEGRPVLGVTHPTFRERALDILHETGRIGLTLEKRRTFRETYVPKFRVSFEEAAEILSKHSLRISAETLRDFARNRTHPMDESNNRLLDQVTEKLRAFPLQTAGGYAAAVENLSIDVKEGTVKELLPPNIAAGLERMFLQPADQSPHEL